MIIHKGRCFIAAASALIIFAPSCSRDHVTCPIAPKSHAFSKANDLSMDGIVLPNGRLITPAGTQVEVVQFPLSLALSPDGRFLAAGGGGYGAPLQGLPGAKSLDPQCANTGGCAGLSLITLPSFTVTSVPLKDHFVGLAFSPSASPDGWRLIVSGGLADKAVNIFTVTTGGALLTDRSIAMPGPSQPSGLALSGDGKTLYVAEYPPANKVAVFDLGTGALVTEVPVGPYPYGCVLSPNGQELYVSNWGGSSVSVISTSSKAVISAIRVGKNPEAIVFTPDGQKVYVANSDDDTISVIDTPSKNVTATIAVGSMIDSPKGASPNALAVSPDGSRLYCASAGDNAVDVISTAADTVIGRIPTAWYPTAVVTSTDGARIFIANAKGEGVGPNMPSTNPNWIYILSLMRGTVSVIPPPDATALALFTQRVLENNETSLDYYDFDCPAISSPIPASLGQSSQIKHVVLIVRENKTYDCLLGDLRKGNGDPRLTLFGRDVTPNIHKLADEFTNLDNFYNDSEVSSQGHMWTAADNSTDYVEKVTPAQYRDGAGPLVAFAGDEINTPKAGVIFDHLKRFGVSYRNYGEIVGVIGKNDPNTNKDYFNTTLSWPPFEVKDVDKAKIFIDELNKGVFPSFVYIWLPNDHTYGTDPGKPTPESMVADNDEATGMIIEAVSHSPFWPSTAIFIIEDDPQDGADHVDAHRSICLVISPWAKRGYISSVHYSFPSLYKTFGLILGFPPISRYDELAPAMYDCFAEAPDVTPYTHVPRGIPEQYNLKIAPMARESSRLDFSQVDKADEMLGRILWTYIHAVREQP